MQVKKINIARTLEKTTHPCVDDVASAYSYWGVPCGGKRCHQVNHDLLPGLAKLKVAPVINPFNEFAALQVLQVPGGFVVLWNRQPQPCTTMSMLITVTMSTIGNVRNDNILHLTPAAAAAAIVAAACASPWLVVLHCLVHSAYTWAHQLHGMTWLWLSLNLCLTQLLTLLLFLCLTVLWLCHTLLF